MKLSIALLSLLIIGCTAINPVTSSRDAPAIDRAPHSGVTISPAQVTATDVPRQLGATVTAAPIGSTQPTATPTARPAPKPKSSVAPLVLQVKSPTDETVVSSPTLLVSGTTTRGAVVSVNGSLATVNPTGAFQLTVSLDEGPNILEIIASDINGNQLSDIVSVIYEP